MELNICAEVLHVIRQIPGCNRAFWIGMKQDQEARLGIDELIQNVPTGMHLALQFKAPRSEPRDQVPYIFTINDRQNNNLLRLAGYRPQAVYYIFPQYNSFTKMRIDSPNLLRDAWLLKVNDLQGLPASTNKQGTHVVRTNPPIAIVRSEPIEKDITSAVEAIRGILRESSFSLESILISHTTLKEWLGYLIDEANGNKFVVG